MTSMRLACHGHMHPIPSVWHVMGTCIPKGTGSLKGMHAYAASNAPNVTQRCVMTDASLYADACEPSCD